MKFSELKNKINQIFNRGELSDDNLSDILIVCRQYEGEKERENLQLAWMASNIANGLLASGDYTPSIAVIKSIEISKDIYKQLEDCNK